MTQINLFFFYFGHLKMFNICQIQPDLARRIARKLTAKDLYNFCNMNLDCHRSVCHNNKFWKDKYEKVNRDDLSQPEDWDWLNYYRKSLQTLYVITLAKKHFVSRGIIDVSSGFHHTGCLTINGNLYLNGSNLRGQLGLPQTQADNGWFLAQQNVKWFLCRYFYTIYIDYDSNCYMTGEIGVPTYGFTPLESNVIDAYINPFPAQNPDILYLTSDHKLHVKSNKPNFLELYNQDTIIIDNNVKKICQSELMPVYIGMDSTMYQFDWLLKEKVPLGLQGQAILSVRECGCKFVNQRELIYHI